MLLLRRHTALLGLALLFFTGCNHLQPGAPSASQNALDPKAAAASGYPALPLPEAPSPLTERPPSGLYAATPAPATLASLSTGTLSPDGRFRMALTDQGAWVARIDGGWLWQISLPAPPPPPQPAPPPGGGPTPPPPPPAPPPTVVGPLVWSPQSTLLFRDSNGNWQEANPATARVGTLPGVFADVSFLTPSPDGRQFFFYRGSQLWTALRDGSQPKPVGAGLIGWWGEDGKLLTRKASAPATQTPEPTTVQKQ